MDTTIVKSNTLKVYKAWLKKALYKEVNFVDKVFIFCEEHYNSGGDHIVECFRPSDIIDRFNNVDQVKEFIGLKEEQKKNQAWG